MMTTSIAVLNDHLGDTRWTLWADEGLPTDVAQRLASSPAYPTETACRVASLAEELEHYLERHSPIRAVDLFLAADGTFEGHCDRFATVRIVERLSQLRLPSMARPAWGPPESTLRRRILTDIEIALVRHCALANVGRATRVGALDSGAISGELSAIVAPDLLTGKDGKPTGLFLRGTMRDVTSGYPVALPRTASLAPWCLPAFAKILQGATAEAPLLYGGDSDEPHTIQSSVLMGVRGVLCDAGLGSDPTVKPLSIRNTRGRAVHDAEGIEAAARLLGHEDLMTVAREIGIRSHEPARRR